MKYATDAQVREAIARWRGNVTAAADELGIQPKNLRKRLEALGLNLASIRRGVGAWGTGSVAPASPVAPSRPRWVEPAPSEPSPGTGRERMTGLSRPNRDAPILRDVSTTTPAVDEHEAPIKGVTVRPKPLRLRPEHQDRLRNAKLDLGARYRVETDENAILDQFFEEAFDAWLRSKMEPQPTPRTRKARAGEKSDPE